MSLLASIMMMIRAKCRDDAISPVVGVMLMIVVVIVIAGVVALFATGIIGGEEEAPVAVLDVVVDSNWVE